MYHLKLIGYNRMDCPLREWDDTPTEAFFCLSVTTQESHSQITMQLNKVFLVHARSERTERNVKLITSAPEVLQTPYQVSGNETVP